MAKGPKKTLKGPVRKALRPGRCYLELLPPELLREIFKCAELTLDQVVALGKRLLPSALEVLYANVQLYSRAMLVKFAASIRAQPHLACVVKDFGLSGRDDPEDGEDGDAWEDASAFSADSHERRPGPDVDDYTAASIVGELDDDRGQGMGLVGATFGMAAPYEPAKLTSDDALLRDLLRRLPSLENLLVFGRARLHAVLDVEFLREGALARLKFFTVSLVGDEDWDDYGDAETCRRLQLLPSLQGISFFHFHNVDGMPIDLENRLPRYRLEPRSWASLREITLNEMSWIGPEIKHLFAAVRPGFKVLKIEALACYDALADDLADLLPDTLEALDISFGDACMCYRGGPLPSFDLVFGRFPLLKHLHLGGPLMSTGAIASLDELPNLHCLDLRYHVPLSGSVLLALVQSPSRTIKCLGAHICTCPDPSRGRARRRPRWHAEFGYSDACKLVRTARKAGVKIGGNLLCAVKMCDWTDGHMCSRM
ncbi:hypothetical protein JCM3770_006611 [Rhodotorula araucariae]